MTRRIVVLGILVGAAAALALAARGVGARENTAEPRYRGTDELVRPEGYRSWVFVGASLGLAYGEAARNEGPGLFHHVYVNPEAHAAFAATGRFPERTMLVMEVYKPEQKVSPNRQGYFEGERTAVEVAVKDKSRFPEGWAYFDFGNGTKAAARPFPRAMCFDCHQKHGASDNVFTQFYPVLRDGKPAAAGHGAAH